MSTNLVKFTQQLFRLRLETWIALDEILKPHDLTVSEWLILHSLNDAKNGLTMSDLASQQGVKKPAVTKNIKEIVGKSFAYRITNPKDDRSVIVGITPIGAKQLKKINRDVKAHQSKVKKQIANGGWNDIVSYLS